MDGSCSGLKSEAPFTRQPTLHSPHWAAPHWAAPHYSSDVSVWTTTAMIPYLQRGDIYCVPFYCSIPAKKKEKKLCVGVPWQQKQATVYLLHVVVQSGLQGVKAKVPFPQFLLKHG